MVSFKGAQLRGRCTCRWPVGVSGSGPIQNHVLKALCCVLVFPIRSHDPYAMLSIALFRFCRLTAADALRVGSWSLADFSCAHQGPNNSRYLVCQCDPNQQR